MVGVGPSLEGEGEVGLGAAEDVGEDVHAAGEEMLEMMRRLMAQHGAESDDEED